MDQSLARAIEMHDEALLIKPETASHNADTCRLCTDWSLRPDGLPSSYSSELGDKPYGDVSYADPGLIDGVARYPIDTESHVRASWAYITNPENTKKYTSAQLEEVKDRISEARSNFSVDDSREGETPSEGEQMSEKTITQETHEALLQTGVEKATKDLESRVTDLEAQLQSVTEERDDLAEKLEQAQEENSSLNGKLDEAQVELKTTKEERDELQSEIAKREEDEAKRQVAEERAKQVRNLDLFPEDHIEERASRWAEMSEEDWAAALEDWKALKPGSPGEGGGGGAPVEQASRISGSSEGSGDEGSGNGKPANPRRAVLGLESPTKQEV